MPYPTGSVATLVFQSVPTAGTSGISEVSRIRPGKHRSAAEGRDRALPTPLSDPGAPDTDHRWSPALSKVTAPVAWTEANDGTQPKKDGPLGNTEIAKDSYWNTNWVP